MGLTDLTSSATLVAITSSPAYSSLAGEKYVTSASLSLSASPLPPPPPSPLSPPLFSLLAPLVKFPGNKGGVGGGGERVDGPLPPPLPLVEQNMERTRSMGHVIIQSVRKEGDRYNLQYFTSARPPSLPSNKEMNVNVTMPAGLHSDRKGFFVGIHI